MSLDVPDTTGTHTVFAAGTHGYHTFRIPAVVDCDGTLLAFAEGRRRGPGDAGPIDLVLRRSDDGGTTWGPLQVVSHDGDHTVGNPCPVLDPRSGEVVLLTVRTAGTATEDRILRGEVRPEDGRRVWLQRSADGGASWSTPADLTPRVKRNHWRWYATGPGHALALRHGPYAGRIVVPANHSTPDTGYGGHLLLSDDGGRSWRIGAEPRGATSGGRTPPVCANETTAAELPDGRIYLNTRNQGGAGPGTRAHTVSSSGGDELDQPYAPVPALVAPVVQGSVACVQGRLVFAGPSVTGARRRMAVRTSGDDGATWTEQHVVWPGPAAYSDLVDLGAGTLGLLYEYGTDGPYERIGFVRLDV